MNTPVTPNDIGHSLRKLDEPYLLVAADADFTILEASDGYLRLIGKQRDDIIGRCVYEVFPENPAAPGESGPSQSRRSFERVVRTGKPHSIGTFRYDIADPQQPGGFTERYWSPLNLPVFDEAGDVQYVLHCAYDVTDLVVQARTSRQAVSVDGHAPSRVLVVEADPEHRERLEALLSNQWDVYVVENPEQALELARTQRFDAVFWVCKACESTQMRFMEELRKVEGYEWVRFVLYLGDDAVTEQYRRAYEAGADDVIGGQASPREFIARLQAQLYEHRLQEVVSQRSLRQIHSLLMEAPVSIALLEGPEHVYTFSNRMRDKRLGGLDTLGKTIAQAFPNEDTSPYEALLDHVYETGEPYFQMDEPVAVDIAGVTRGEEFLTFAMVPYRDIDGEVEGVVLFTFDVTELVNMQREAEAYAAQIAQESRRKDDFLALLSHELRDPLAPIASAIDVLELAGGMVSAEKVRWATRIISRQARQLARLVNDLLDVARISQGRIELQRCKCELSAMIETAVETVRPLVEERQQSLEVDLATEAVACEVDRERIVQVLTNLLHNASQYTPEGGKIRLMARTDDDMLHIVVEDNGAGINAEFLPRVFDVYARAETASASSVSGLGLGLALVKQLVEMHHGSVEAHSDGANKGSRFTVSLPQR